MICTFFSTNTFNMLINNYLHYTHKIIEKKIQSYTSLKLKYFTNTPRCPYRCIRTLYYLYISLLQHCFNTLTVIYSSKHADICLFQ